MRNILFLILALLVSSATCTDQKEGVDGKVLWVTGNQMPGVGATRAPGKGVVREIYFYEPVQLSSLQKQPNGFFGNIPSKLVEKTTSDADGNFKVQLPAGDYSVFTKEEGGFWANIFGENGVINPVTVKPGSFTPVTITINYEAAY